MTRRSRSHRAAASAALCLAGACYTYAPAGEAPAPGRHVALDLSDAGRAAVAAGVGAGAERVEGELVSRTDSLVTLRVTGVRYRGGAVTRWAGESLAVRTSDVAVTRERRLSRGRTVALVTTIAGALVALAVTQDLSIFGSPGRTGTGTGGGPDQ